MSERSNPGLPACPGPRALRRILLPALLCGAVAVAAASELRDPLRPPNHQPDAAIAIDPSNWQLTSTLVAAGRRVAVINGRVVGAGDSIDGADVIGIARSSVRLRVGEHRFTIESSTPSIRATRGEEPRP